MTSRTALLQTDKISNFCVESLQSQVKFVNFVLLFSKDNSVCMLKE